MGKKALEVKNDIGYFKPIRIPLLEMVYSMVDQFLWTLWINWAYLIYTKPTLNSESF